MWGALIERSIGIAAVRTRDTLVNLGGATTGFTLSLGSRRLRVVFLSPRRVEVVRADGSRHDVRLHDVDLAVRAITVAAGLLIVAGRIIRRSPR